VGKVAWKFDGMTKRLWQRGHGVELFSCRVRCEELIEKIESGDWEGTRVNSSEELEKIN
jgi:hypothetical protein